MENGKDNAHTAQNKCTGVLSLPLWGSSNAPWLCFLSGSAVWSTETVLMNWSIDCPAVFLTRIYNWWQRKYTYIPFFVCLCLFMCLSIKKNKILFWFFFLFFGRLVCFFFSLKVESDSEFWCWNSSVVSNAFPQGANYFMAFKRCRYPATVTQGKYVSSFSC